jgi:hypothetical protein
MNNDALQVPQDPTWLSILAISPSSIVLLLLKLAYSDCPLRFPSKEGRIYVDAKEKKWANLRPARSVRSLVTPAMQKCCWPRGRRKTWKIEYGNLQLAQCRNLGRISNRFSGLAISGSLKLGWSGKKRENRKSRRGRKRPPCIMVLLDEPKKVYLPVPSTSSWHGESIPRSSSVPETSKHN